VFHKKNQWNILAMESGMYKTIKTSSQGIYKEKGSRFISFAYHVSNHDEIKILIDKNRKDHYEARHHCYAFMIGHERSDWRINDDGEPSGTAGRPILGQINSSGLTNILIVVNRYFGGRLLGVSGLITAYRSAAANAISNAQIIEYTLLEYYEITFKYNSMNDVMKILKEEGIGQSDQIFDLECFIKINFRVSDKEKVLKRLSRIEGLKYRFIEII
jgi:uncharacterized YigZ family protein